MEEEKCKNSNEEQDFSLDEVVYNNNFLLNALLDLLIEKNIITEEEFQRKLDENDEESESSEEEKESEE